MMPSLSIDHPYRYAALCGACVCGSALLSEPPRREWAAASFIIWKVRTTVCTASVLTNQNYTSWGANLGLALSIRATVELSDQDGRYYNEIYDKPYTRAPPYLVSQST
jgi:hypothetical protein